MYLPFKETAMIYIVLMNVLMPNSMRLALNDFSSKKFYPCGAGVSQTFKSQSQNKQ